MGRPPRDGNFNHEKSWDVKDAATIRRKLQKCVPNLLLTLSFTQACLEVTDTKTVATINEPSDVDKLKHVLKPPAKSRDNLC